MGQQQILLILLGVVVVGAAIVLGITLFGDNAVSANRDALTTDLAALAERAQLYYRKPRVYGGGGNSFTGLAIGNLSSKPKNANGHYLLTSVSTNKVVIDGVGVEKGSNGNDLSVTMTVFSDSTGITVNN